MGDRGDRSARRAANALVVTDQPIVLFRAKRATTGPLVDISNTRVTGGTLTAGEVNAEIRRSRPDAVLVDRMLRFLPAVIAAARPRLPLARPLRLRRRST